MSNFVLVGGAWIGAWAWRDVERHLRAQGHDSFALSLTGLAERKHLGGPETNLETHIADVVNLLQAEDLHDVVLVGHSYSGIVVTGVADRVPERLKTLAFCDSAPAPNGMCFLDFSPPEAQQAVRRTVEEHGSGWQLPFPGIPALGQQASLSGLDVEQQRLLAERATPHPFGSYTQRLQLQADGARPYQRAMIQCQDGQRLLEFARGQSARGNPMMQDMVADDWRVLELDTGHWPMLSCPAELAGLFGKLG